MRNPEERTRGLRVSAAAAGFAILLLAGGAAGEPLAVDSEPVPLVRGEPGEARVGFLIFRGGVRLDAHDPRFGGLSGLIVSDHGITAITDAGHWITGRLIYEDNRLVAVDDTHIFPLRDATGAALQGKREGDAEEVVRAPDGGLLVAFEGRHRIVRYAGPDSAGIPVWPELDLSHLPSNKGIEAMTPLGDGGFLALSETASDDNKPAGWLISALGEEGMDYPVHEFFKPTAAALLPSGQVLVLERGYSLLAGVKARIMEIAPPRAGVPANPREIARFEPPVTVDNFEALAVFQAPDGGMALLIASDDNFNPLQRTLLMMFTLAEQ